MFSETRYALNGTCASPIARHAKAFVTSCSSRPGSPHCEVFPELPSVQGWVEAMTSLGRLISPDQPGTGASYPVTPGALPTMEQWADSITAVLDDLGSREAVLLTIGGSFATGALFAATHPSRTTALVVLEGYASFRDATRRARRGSRQCNGCHVGDRGVRTSDQSRHALERGDPGNVGSSGTSGGKPRDRCSHDASAGRNGRAGAASRPSACQPSSSSTPTTHSSRLRWASTLPITYRARNTSNCRDATCTTSLNRGATPSRRSPSSSPARQADVADDRVSPRSFSPTSWIRHAGPRRWATVTGTRCSTHTTPSSDRSCLAFGAVR